jgi:hypothetical protein
MYRISRITGAVETDQYELIDDEDGSRVNPFEFGAEYAEAFESFMGIWTDPIDANVERVSVNRRTLARMYASFLQARNDKKQARFLHTRDISMIGERMMEEARCRSWCAEYDQIVASLNENLIINLPQRAREFKVSIVATVTAEDESTAMDMGRELARSLEASAYVDEVHDTAQS